MIQLYNLIGFLFIIVYWILIQIYILITCRTKIVKIKSIVDGFGLYGHYLIDSNSNYYYIQSNLMDKIINLKLNSYYEIKIYGFNSKITTLNIIDINPS